MSLFAYIPVSTCPLALITPHSQHIGTLEAITLESAVCHFRNAAETCDRQLKVFPYIASAGYCFGQECSNIVLSHATFF